MVNTTNNAAVVDEDALTVRRSISIQAPRSAVWRAITDPQQISRWFGHTVLDRVGAGATGTMTFPHYGSIPLRVEEYDEPHRITYAWNNDDALQASDGLLDHFDAARATTFTFTLDDEGEGTLLTVVETGFERTQAPLENLRSHVEGWNEEIDKLVALVEGDA